MQFSELHQITKQAEDDWFDPLMTRDTQLYVDPFRIYADPGQQWTGSHAHLITFFTMVMGYVAEAGGNERHPAWQKAKNLLLFPEPEEFCLGDTKTGIRGSGSGPGLQKAMLEGAQAALGSGVTLEHMEMLVLFGGGIGVDRLSDMTCNVLKNYFIAYTQEVCRRHGVPMAVQRVRHSGWDETYGRWVNEDHELPENPFFPGSSVLLVPRRFLREIPTVDASDFWNYAWANEGEQLRGDFNYDLGSRVPAALKARLARQHVDLLHDYLMSLERNPKPAYDLVNDPKFKIRWHEGAVQIAHDSPLSYQPSTVADFATFIEAIIDAFNHGLEDSDLARLLWNGSVPRPEKDVQSLFHHTVLQYCNANGVEVSPESNAGRGPVDFKFVGSFSAKALAELKLTSNSAYWSGLQTQLVQYLKSEQTSLGYFLSVGFFDKDFNEERLARVRVVAERVSADVGRTVKVRFIDARIKPSASKVHSPAPSKE